VEIVGGVCFLLPSCLAQILAEVALLIQQAYTYQRHAQIAGRFDVVARQYAQSPRENRKAFGEAELGGEVCHEQLTGRRMHAPEPGILAHARRQGARNTIQMRQK
jgi:hypothetical protein